MFLVSIKYHSPFKANGISAFFGDYNDLVATYGRETVHNVIKTHLKAQKGYSDEDSFTVFPHFEIETPFIHYERLVNGLIQLCKI